jgi:hypothetical protein
MPGHTQSPQHLGSAAPKLQILHPTRSRQCICRSYCTEQLRCAPVDGRQRADVAGQLQGAGADQEQARLGVVGAWASQNRHASDAAV